MLPPVAGVCREKKENKEEKSQSLPCIFFTNFQVCGAAELAVRFPWRSKWAVFCGASFAVRKFFPLFSFWLDKPFAVSRAAARFPASFLVDARIGCKRYLRRLGETWLKFFRGSLRSLFLRLRLGRTRKGPFSYSLADAPALIQI